MSIVVSLDDKSPHVVDTASSEGRRLYCVATNTDFDRVLTSLKGAELSLERTADATSPLSRPALSVCRKAWKI